jgi:hypothetical protein
MTREEYDLLKQRIRETYRRDLEALERVWALARNVGPIIPGPSPNSPLAPPAQSCQAPHDVNFDQLPIIGMGGTGSSFQASLPEVVRGVLLNLAERFTVHDVQRAIANDHPDLAGPSKRPSITSALNRLVETHEITLLQAGRGKRPSLFGRIQDSQQNGTNGTGFDQDRP